MSLNLSAPTVLPFRGMPASQQQSSAHCAYSCQLHLPPFAKCKMPWKRPAAVRRGGAPAPIIQHAGEHFSNIMRVRRRGKFVGYGINLFVLLRALDHGIDETRPVRAKHPGHPHNKMPILSRKHVLFSRKLRFAVSADWIRLILFCVRRAFLPVENIIGTEVNQLASFSLQTSARTPGASALIRNA